MAVDVDVWFLWACLACSDVKTINFKALARATNLKEHVVRVRFSRLKHRIEQDAVEHLVSKAAGEYVAPHDTGLSTADRYDLQAIHEEFEINMEDETQEPNDNTTWPSIYPKVDFTSYMNLSDGEEESELTVGARVHAHQVRDSESRDFISSSNRLENSCEGVSGSVNIHQQLDACLRTATSDLSGQTSAESLTVDNMLGTKGHSENPINRASGVRMTWGRPIGKYSPTMEQVTNQGSSNLLSRLDPIERQPPNATSLDHNDVYHYYDNGLESLEKPIYSSMSFRAMHPTKAHNFPRGASGSSQFLNHQMNWLYGPTMSLSSQSKFPPCGFFAHGGPVPR